VGQGNGTSHIDVRYVADLARLELTDEEVEKFQGELESVLTYVDTLSRLDLSDIEPTAHANPQANVWREDGASESMCRDDVIRNAPDSAEGKYIRVPPIIEE